MRSGKNRRPPGHPLLCLLALACGPERTALRAASSPQSTHPFLKPTCARRLAPSRLSGGGDRPPAWSRSRRCRAPANAAPCVSQFSPAESGLFLGSLARTPARDSASSRSEERCLHPDQRSSLRELALSRAGVRARLPRNSPDSAGENWLTHGAALAGARHRRERLHAGGLSPPPDNRDGARRLAQVGFRNGCVDCGEEAARSAVLSGPHASARRQSSG